MRPRCDHGMARTTHTIKPSLSTDPKDKLLACLNWPIGRWKRRNDAAYQAAPLYFDACWEWYRRLSSEQQDEVCDIVDAWSMSDRRKAAESWAEVLPPAPTCPL